MPRSSGRAKRPAALSGIPQRVNDLSPRDWEPNRRAAWCRAYLAGASNPKGRCPEKMRDMAMAFRRGQETAPQFKTEVAQVEDTQRIRTARQETRQRQMRRARDRFPDPFDAFGLDFLPTASPLWFPRAMGGRRALQPESVDVTSPDQIPAGSVLARSEDILP